MSENPDAAVLERLEQEKADARGELKEVQKKLPAAQKEYDRAWEAERKIHPDKPVPDQIKRRSDLASQVLFGWLSREEVLKRRISHLESPEELERRTSVNTRIKEVRRMAAERKPTAADQGVPDAYLNKATGKFKPGLDARYKSDLILSVLGEKSNKMLHTFGKEAAMERLEERGWVSFLDKARKSREIKVAKVEKAAAAKANSKPAAGKKAGNGRRTRRSKAAA